TNQIRQLNVMASHNPALNNHKVREALAKAIDRNALGEIGKPAIAGTSKVPEAVPDHEKVGAIPFDPEAARAALADAGYEGGEGMPTVTLLDFQNSPWVQAIGEMWKENLNVEYQLDIVEIGVYSAKRAEVHDEDYTGFFVNNVAV